VIVITGKGRAPQGEGGKRQSGRATISWNTTLWRASSKQPAKEKNANGDGEGEKNRSKCGECLYWGRQKIQMNQVKNKKGILSICEHQSGGRGQNRLCWGPLFYRWEGRVMKTGGTLRLKPRGQKRRVTVGADRAVGLFLEETQKKNTKIEGPERKEKIQRVTERRSALKPWVTALYGGQKVLVKKVLCMKAASPMGVRL